MTHEDRADLNKLWQDQPVEKEEVRMTLEDIRSRARRMEKRGGWRNLREYAAAVAVVIACVVLGAREHNPIVLSGEGFMVLGALYVVYHLHRYGTVRPLPAELALKDCLEFHRTELVRQRDLLRSVWWWYLLPLIPSLALILIGRLIEHPDRWLRGLAVAAVFIATFVVVGQLNTYVARRLQRRIDEIDRVRG